MIKKTLLFIAVAIFAFLLPNPVFAEGEFSSSYNVTYDISNEGVTTVNEKIIFKNLTDRFYPSNFSLIIAASDVWDVSAFDSSLFSLETKTSKEGKKTRIQVVFSNQQVVGKGKEYSWNLVFKSKDFAQNNGKVWQVSVPKIKEDEGIEKYDLTVSVPVSFGDPATITPEPKRQSESNGKINFMFEKGQLLNAGVVANFGTEQLIEFEATYNLFNNRLLPYVMKLPLPPNSDYQEVILKDIQPKPQNVIEDEEGNLTALFEVGRKQNFQVKIRGLGKLHNKKKLDPPSGLGFQKYLKSSKYWEKDNPIIQSKLSEILKDTQGMTNSQKADRINDFVSDYLTFDYNRLTAKDYQRLGALTALNNPDKSLDSEYVDLTIALLRCAQIPARQLVGFAGTNTSEIRPLSYQNNFLHSWVEFYDPETGWQMIDPAWESTSGGVDYFSSVDLNHLSLYRLWELPEDIFTVIDLKTKYSDEKFEPKEDLSLNFDVSDKFISGFSQPIKVKFTNIGSKNYPESEFKLTTGLTILGKDGKRVEKFDMPELAPFGVFEAEYNLRSTSVFDSFEDKVELELGNKKVSKTVLVEPFYENKFVTIFAVLVVNIIIFVYVFTLVMHIKVHKTSKHQSKA